MYFNVSRTDFKFQCGDKVRFNTKCKDKNPATSLNGKILIIDNILPEFKYLVVYKYNNELHSSIIEEKFLEKI